MDNPADFNVVEADGARTVRLSGDWTASHLGDAAVRLRGMLDKGECVDLDLKDIRRMDTAGAYGLIRATRDNGQEGRLSARPETKRLLELVGQAIECERSVPKRTISFNDLMERLGRGAVGVIREFVETMTFNGHLLAVTWRTILNPSRLRFASTVDVMERAGVDAIPVVLVTNFFIGAVVGLLGAHSLAALGAQAFAVEGVGIGILREFGIVITAVLLAGRSASSFAAEIGSMKMQQEIDAMRVLGVDPFEGLVLPRFLALLFMTPLLTFLACLAGLFGGCLVLWMAVGLSPQFFLQRIIDNVGITQFWLGMAKAPVMAIAIAAIGCRQGMEVGGDVESLGRRVTAAVVHAIFSIIFIDAAFAVMYMAFDI
ncbi:ABC transporter permease [soil metagenome]